MFWLDGYPLTSLAGDHFLADIALSSHSKAGIILPERDPRRQKKKPDAYAGKILDVSPWCERVKKDDLVVFERWDWQQEDARNERIIARERDLIIVNEKPCSDYIIFQLEDLSYIRPTLSQLIPQTMEKSKPAALAGVVISSSVDGYNEGERYIFQYMDSYQFHYGDGRVAFRYGKGADILAKYESTGVLEVV